ncbi:xanthine dehydrogenase family Fe-S subunit [Leptospira interrogans]
MTRIALTVNGKDVSAEVTPRTHLADFLREQLLLTGTHLGCEHGICGACTVEINGEIARSCITYAVACDGASVRTIEGFDDDPLMAGMRKAFTEEHALQCGFCTPGMLIAARDLVRRKSGLSRPEIRFEMSGNLCRCTGYAGIVNAIERMMDTPSPVTAASRSEWLGPAPGPTAATVAIAAPVAPARPSKTPAPSTKPAPVVTSRRDPIKVTVGAIETVDGQTGLTQSFTLPHPRDDVWRVLSDPEEIARCMPGMVLDGPVQDGQARGHMEVKLGPIVASFAGEGTFERFDAEYRQVVEGRGNDRKSGSRATGRVEYQLLPVTVGDQEQTEVQATISYSLTGPLAQFSRSGLVRDLVARIGELFAQGVDARLSGVEAAPQQLGGISLMLRILTGRLRDWLARLKGR